jgi:hypothetical protein
LAGEDTCSLSMRCWDIWACCRRQPSCEFVALHQCSGAQLWQCLRWSTCRASLILGLRNRPDGNSVPR